MLHCPIHDVRMVIKRELLLTGRTARVHYCSKCDDVYIPKSEFSKYDDDAALRRKLASALGRPATKLRAVRRGRTLSIVM